MSSASTAQPSRTSNLAIVLIYAVFAAAWVLLSDKVVESYFTDPAQITLASTVKGWLFVIITSLLLYKVMRRFPGGANTTVTLISLRSMAVPILLLTGVIATLTAGGIAHTTIQHKDREVARLQAIADLKVRQIADWLKEKHGDARFVQTSPLFAENYLRWRNSGDISSRDRLIARLEDYQRYHSTIDAILLLDDQGERLWGSANAPVAVSPILSAAARQASLNRQVGLIGPYLGVAGQPRLDFVAPLTKAGTHPPVIVIDADLEGHLFPMMSSWPVPSSSGETLIFRRDGNEVLFLNQLRFRPGTAAQLRVPVTAQEMLSAQILRDPNRLDRLIEGMDYRGEPVMGVARAVPGTDWFLIAKLDKAELFSETAEDAVWIALAGLLALLMSLSGVFIFRQRQQIAIEQSVHKSQEERLRALHLLDSIANSSTDAIFAQDTEGRFILFNRAAQHLTGKSEKDALGRDETTLFPSQIAEQLKADNRRMITENRVLTFEDHLATPDGECTFLTTKGPLYDAEGNIFGMFGIARDITAMKQVEMALRLERDRRQHYLDTVQTFMVALDSEGRITMINRVGCELLGYEEHELLGRNWFEDCLPQPAGMEQVFPVFRQIMAGNLENVEHFENPVRCRDGRERLIAWHNATLTDETGRITGTLSSGEDITEKKQADLAIERQAEELIRRNDELERFNRAVVGRELDMIELKRQVNELSRALGREPPYSLDFADTLALPPGGDRQ